MISNPKYGDRVQCWYGPRSRDVMPYHGQCGSVVIVGTGRPRNHGVKFYNADGTSSTITVPAGNLRPEPAPAPDCPHLNPPDDVLAAAWKVRMWMDEVFPPNESAQLCGLTRSPAH